MNCYSKLEKYSSSIAIITETSEYISYEKLLKSADDIGRKISKKCLVFIICKNCFESVAGYIGFMRAGIVPVLINSTIDNALFENLLEAYKPEYIYLPEEKSELAANYKRVHALDDYILFETGCKADYAIHDDLALLLTTSGSTGSPKFVRLSYENIESNAVAIAQYLDITSADRPITTMPMSYSYGLSIINSHLIKGSSIILTDLTLMDKFFWKIIKENNATTFGGVPYTYQILKKLRFERMDLPGLKYITQAGGKLDPEISAEFAEICMQKNIKYFVMYGQTEAAPRMSYLPWEHVHSKVGSIGIAIPGGEFRLEDEHGNSIEENNAQGELVYQGDNVALGYAESCLDLSKGDENNGTLYTGDMAERDKDGFYYITGRKKRFLKLFGNRVNLDEVEQIIRSTGCDCVCSGTDDKLKIYVTNPDDQELIRSCIVERIGINKAGFIFVHIERIPRSDSGKVMYTALEEERKICSV